MSLLAQVNQPNENNYYFALEGGGGGGVTTAPQFVATGGAAAGGFISTGPGANVILNNGSFVSDIATLGLPAQGADVIVMRNILLDRARWTLGFQNPEIGLEQGADFAIRRCNDAGIISGTPLAIDRSSGLVTMESDAIVGESGTVGGGVLSINGTLGLGRVYDPLYNPPPPATAGVEVINTTWGPTGAIVTNPTYTPTVSGLYSVTMEVKADANGGFTWVNGINCIMGYFQSPFPPFTLLSDSFMACDSLASPLGMSLPIPPGGSAQADAYAKDIVALVNLTAGVAYAAQINIDTTGFNLGTTGGIRFFIQPLLA